LYWRSLDQTWAVGSNDALPFQSIKTLDHTRTRIAQSILIISTMLSLDDFNVIPTELFSGAFIDQANSREEFRHMDGESGSQTTTKPYVILTSCNRFP
jgi:hypothetical protein